MRPVAARMTTFVRTSFRTPAQIRRGRELNGADLGSRIAGTYPQVSRGSGSSDKCLRIQAESESWVRDSPRQPKARPCDETCNHNQRHHDGHHRSLCCARRGSASCQFLDRLRRPDGRVAGLCRICPHHRGRHSRPGPGDARTGAVTPALHEHQRWTRWPRSGAASGVRGTPARNGLWRRGRRAFLRGSTCCFPTAPRPPEPSGSR